MICPLCGTRKARRGCPALGRSICSVCCGTKRLVEIRCPADCGYLASSREHPPAAVERQREADYALLLPVVRDLGRRQAQIFFLLQAAVARHRPDGLYSLSDDDVAEATAAFAATIETAERGVIYQHHAGSLPAEHLVRALRQALDEVRGDGGHSFDRDAAVALRRIEVGARTLRRQAGGSPTAYLELAQRFASRMPEPTAAAERAPEQSESRIIWP
ncbi:MAG TPA: hypothetical protein VIC33_04135 [Vicinamibacterales bacterium]|jgi:hypothetical protein